MPYIPHAADDVAQMLAAIPNANSIQDLFDEIPDALIAKNFPLPAGLSEMEVQRVVTGLAQTNQALTCFAGAGAYDHHIPAAVWEVATRGEYYSAYTPYQAEASQGTLQLLYEYQSLICRLLAMEASNASLYDGASATAEAVLMALRCQRKKPARILVPTSLLPSYRQTLQSLIQGRQIDIVDIPIDSRTGRIDEAVLHHQTEGTEGDFAAMILPCPNQFGVIEDVHGLTDWIHSKQALVIAQVNPILAAVVSPPGEWGEGGADIAFGDGQPLGIPLSYGGPHYGFITCKMGLVRQLPGRIIGKTTEENSDKVGYVLTLQAREQHIRRDKATSNICSNQGLMVTGSTIYMALMGAEGLKTAAKNAMINTRRLVESAIQLPGVSACFAESPMGYETLLALPKPASSLITAGLQQGVLMGVDIMASPLNQSSETPHQYSILVSATEKRTEADIDQWLTILKNWLTGASQ